MKRLESKIGRMLSVLMVFFLTFVMCFSMPQSAEAASVPKGYVTVSMEKFTLGLGYIVEPVRVPIYEGDTGAKIITRLMDENLGKGSYKHTGSIGNQSGVVGQTFYLASVKDRDKREAKIPKYILDVCDEPYGRNEKDWLGEFDYTFMSGWMYAVNNWFPNYGSGQYKLKDGDVMRWQYTVWGYGADLGSTFMSGDSGTDALVKAANKDKLTTAIAKINSSDKKEYILQDKDVKLAYDNGYKVLQNMESKQDKVDDTLTTLNKALDNVEIPKTLSVSTISNQEYTGKEIKPLVTVKDGSKKLKSGTDYTLSYSNNKKVGTAKVKVIGKNNYKKLGKEVTFKILPRKVKNVKASATTSSVKLTWDKVPQASGYRIYRYNSKTKSYDHISTISKNSTTSYTNSKRSPVTSYSYKVRAYTTDSKKTYYGNFSDVKKITTKPSTPSIKLRAGSKKIKVSWNKITNASGYEVYRSTSKSGKYSKINTITKGSTLSYTNSKLTKKKAYYYKVRSYKTIDGNKVYSSFSTVKYTKVK